MSPQRIQRKRTKGWRMPEGAIYVGRPGKWGNPWSIREWAFLDSGGGEARDLAVSCFRQMLNERDDLPLDQPAHNYPSRDEIRSVLAGHDLACWCPLDQPCHADVLLKIANGGAR